jgi:hypothetical protein
VRPELVERVFQFMQTEKESAEKLREKAENRVEKAMKKV